jgi:hypothetical protein
MAKLPAKPKAPPPPSPGGEGRAAGRASAEGERPPKPKAPLLHHLAGTTSKSPPPAPSPGGEGRGEGERAPGFIVEVLEAKEEAGEILAVESGRGRIIRASAKDAEILKPAPGSKHKRIRLTPGKFHYE